MLVSPYKNIKQYTKIKLLPHQLNSDIRNNMKLSLKKKIEKKCNKNGFVDEVYRIVSFEDGILIPENLSGNVIYDVCYHCKICIPIEDTIIIGQINIINQELIIAKNGPMFIFIPKNQIDTNIWDIVENFLHKTKKTNLKINDYVKIQIVNKRINQGDREIKAIGRLLDYASDNEIEKYYGNVIQLEEDKEVDVVEKEVNKTHFII